MTDLTPARLAEIRAIAEKATPGPWKAVFDENDRTWNVRDAETDTGFSYCQICAGFHQGNPEGQHDAAYVATMDPSTVIAMVDEIARLRAEATIARRKALEDVSVNIFNQLGEAEHKFARWSHGADPYEYWSRESIEKAIRSLIEQGGE